MHNLTPSLYNGHDPLTPLSTEHPSVIQNQLIFCECATCQRQINMEQCVCLRHWPPPIVVSASSVLAGSCSLSLWRSHPPSKVPLVSCPCQHPSSYYARQPQPLTPTHFFSHVFMGMTGRGGIKTLIKKALLCRMLATGHCKSGGRI